MNWTSTSQRLRNSFFVLVSIMIVTLLYTKSYAQTKNYTEVAPSSGTVLYAGGNSKANDPGAGSIDQSGNAAIITPSKPAVLHAKYFNLLGLVGSEGEAWIQLKYANPVATGKTTYIRFDQPTFEGINLDLLATIGDLTGLLSKNYVQVDAYTGASAGNDGSLIRSGVTTTIVKDAAGQNYFAITSSSAYNSVRIRLRFKGSFLGLNLGSTMSMNVYTAFNYTADNCGTSIFTNFGESGLNVSLTDLVINPERAIDGDLATFSHLQPGLVAAASSVSQTIYLNGLSAATDVAKVVLSQPGDLLSVDVFNTIRLQAYNGEIKVGNSQTVGSLLSVQLLGLFSKNNKIPLFFTPGGQFDRIKITLDNGLAIGGNILGGGLNVHEVQRTVPEPSFAGIVNGAVEICGGHDLTLAALNPDAGYTYSFYKKADDAPVLVRGPGEPTLIQSGLAPGTYTYYVAAQKSGCAGESDMQSITVTVKPTLVFTATSLTNITAGKAYAKQIRAATGGIPGYTYAVAAGSTLPAGLAISSAGLLSGIPAAAGDFAFSVSATDKSGCIATANYTLKVTETLTFPTATLPNGTVGKPYPPTIISAPTGGSTPYTYNAADLPPGLNLNPATGEITGTPTTGGTFTVPVTVTDADGNTVVTDFTIVVRDQVVLPATTLAEGTTDVTYPTQIIPAATGGSGTFTYTATGLPPGLSFNPETREITGTPTQPGTFTIPVVATDNEGNTVSTDYTIVVKDPLVLGSVNLPDGGIGTEYPLQTIPAASGGTGTYTYTATGLPPGLAFDPVTREITGTPTQSGIFAISVTVKDDANNSVTVPYAIKVAGVLDLPSASLSNGIVGTSYTSEPLPPVTGGTGPYTYTMDGLPDGLTFNAGTRTISGIPASGGDFTVTMNVSDGDGLTTSTAYGLKITVGVPVVDGSAICEGNKATLIVSNPVSGVNYNFYAATGNTPVSTTAPYATDVLTETTTFYVEAVSGSAVSARVPVLITVNPAPELPTVATKNQTISKGGTATLQATAAPGTTVKWYAGATGGTALGESETYTTGELNANTTYYVETTSISSGCASLSRVPVTVTVTDLAPDPNCNAATKQESSIKGICLACAIDGPGFSTDADPNNFTEIHLVVGLGGSGYQRLIFQKPGAATDSIRLDLETPTGLLDLSVLGGITIRVMNGAAIVKSYPLNQALLNLSILGGNRFKATVLATAAYDRVEVLFGSAVGLLNSLRIYGAEVIYPNPDLVSGDQTICSGTKATLKATPAAGTTIAWYSDAEGGSIVSSEAEFTTAALTATTTYYIQVTKDGCVNAVRVPVKVTVIPTVTTPVLKAISPVCAGSTAVLEVDQPQDGITYNWYDVPAAGTPVFSGAVFTIPDFTASKTYYLEASNGTCLAAERVTAALIANPLPVVPQIQTAITTINPGQSVRLTASSTETNVTFNWYSSADATTPVYTGQEYVTPSLSSTTTFYLEAVSATGCASARVQQTILVNGDGTPVPVECETPVSQTTGVGGVLSVFARVDNPLLAIDGDQQTGSTLSIPIGLGASVFQKVNFTGLSNVGDTVRIRLSGSDRLLSVDLLPSVTITTFNGSASNNDAVVVNSALLSIKILNGGRDAEIDLVPTAQFDGVEVRLNTLAGALSAINFNYARRITRAPEVDAAAVTACLNAPVTLTVKNPQPGIVYKWYDADGKYLGNDGTTFITPAIAANTNFYVSASRGDCGSGSRTQIEVTLTPAPEIPVLLSATAATCQNSSLDLTVQNPQDGVTYQWYNGSAAISGATAATYHIDNIQADGVYSVEAVNSCGTVSAEKATVAVTVGTLSAPVLTPPAVTVNAGEKAVLTASSSTAGLIYTWYATDPSLPGAVAASTPDNGENGSFITPVLTASTTYYVVAQSTTAGGCQSAAASVLVTVNTEGTSPGSVPCEPAISQTINKGGLLSVLAGVANPGKAVDDDVETSSSLFIPLGTGSFVSQKVMFDGLSQVGDKVRLRITSPGGLLSAGVAQSIVVTTYNGSASNGDQHEITSSLISLHVLAEGKSWEIEFTPEKVFDGVELKLNSGLLTALTAINFNYAQRIIKAPEVDAAAITVCLNTPVTLAVKNPQSGIVYKWYDADGKYLGNDGATFITPAIAANTKFYVSASRGTCEGDVRTQIEVTVVPAPETPVLLSATAETCQNSSLDLTVQNPQDGVTYQWYNGSAAISGATAATYHIDNIQVDGVYSVEAVNSCGTVSAEKATVAVTVGTLSAPVLTPPAVTVNAGEKAVLTASSSTAGLTYTWYATDPSLPGAVAVSTPDNGENGSFITPVLTASTTYYVVAQSTTAGGCQSGAASVLVTVNTVGADPGSVPCEPAISQTINKGGLLSVLADVANPGKAVDDDVETSSSLFIPLGTGSFVSQKVMFDGLSQVGDKVRLRITSPGGLLSAGVAQSIVVTTYNGSASNGDQHEITSSLISLHVLAEGKSWEIEFTPEKVFDGVELRLNSGLLTALTAINFNYAQRIIVAPTVASADVTVCKGNAATLVVTNRAPGVTYKWYAADPSDPTVPGTAVSTSANGENGTFITPADLVPGDHTYFVAAIRGCESPTKIAVKVTVSPSATAADITVSGLPASVCEGSSISLTASSTTVTDPIFTWYSDAALANAVSTGATFTATVTASTSYYVTVHGSNKCDNAAADAKVVALNVNPPATAADITISGLPASVCEGSSISLTASSTTVTDPIFTWYSDAALANAVSTGATFTATVTASTSYYVTVHGSNKCDNAAADAKVVTLNVNPPATAADITVSGLPASVCEGSSISLTASSTTVTDPVFTWYSDAALANAVSTGATFTATVTASASYYVTVHGSNKCDNASADAKVVALNVNPPATAADITVSGLPASVCEGSSISLTASSTTVTDPIFTWYSDAALANAVSTGATFTATVTASASYYVTVHGSNKCDNAAADAKVVALNVNPTATAADITVSGLPASVCEGSSISLTASSTTVTDPVFTWYSDAALANAVSTGATFTATVTASTSYYVTVHGSNKCDNAAADAKVVALNVNPPATAADITVSGAPAIVCAGTGVSLTAGSTTVTDPVFTWYSDAALANAVFTGAVFDIPALTAATTYYVTVHGSNRCENAEGTANVVTLNVNPAIVFNGGALNDASVSSTYSVQLNAATGGTPAYTYALVTGSTLPAGLSLSSAGVLSGTPSAPGSYTFSVMATDSKGCNATADFSLRVGGAIIMSLPPASLPDGQVGTIYTPQTLPAAVGGTGPDTYTAEGLPPGLTFNPETREITGTPTLGGTFTVAVTVTDANGLTATGSYVIVVTVPAPVVAGAESCGGASVTLTITNPVSGVTYNWYAAATGGSIIYTGTSLQTPPVTATTSYYIAGVSGTATTSRVPVSVTVPPVLATPVVTVQSSTITSVTFTWNAIAGATGYEVSSDGGATWKQSSGDLTHVVGGVQTNASVTLMVRAKGTTACQTSIAGNATGIANNGMDTAGTEVYIPNTFTPNGDGKNDIFYVYGNAIVNVKMQVYNQWGQFIYQSLQLQNGWDGTYKGQMQPNGVYIYYIELVLTDGTKTVRKGTITLLR